MPYEVVKKGDKYCVVKQDGGKEIGCHPSESEAKAQMAAIYANEHKEFHLTPKPAGFFSKVKSSVTVIKGKDGLRLMLMVTTNNYKDRDNEIIAAKALQAYVDRAWRVEDKCLPDNPLLFWHRSDPIGDIVWTKMHNGFLLEVAKERPDARIKIGGEKYIWETTVKTLWSAIERDETFKWGASHGFKYPDGEFKDGVYGRIRKFESSTLPLPAAANLLTFSGVMKDMNADNADKVLEKLFEQAGYMNSPDMVRRFLKGAGELKKAADSAGLEQKSHDTEKEIVKGILDRASQIVDAAFAKLSDKPVDPAVKTAFLHQLVEALAVPDSEGEQQLTDPDPGDQNMMASSSTPAPEDKPGEANAVSGKQVKAWEAVVKALDALTTNDVETSQTLKQQTEVLTKVVKAIEPLAELPAQFKSLETRLAAVETKLSGAPRRAAADPATVVTDKALTDKAAKALENTTELFPGSGVRIYQTPPSNGKEG